MPSCPSAGDAVTEDPVEKDHITTPVAPEIAYTFLSLDPTYNIPLEEMTGEDCMDVPLLSIHRDATVGPSGPCSEDWQLC